MAGEAFCTFWHFTIDNVPIISQSGHSTWLLVRERLVPWRVVICQLEGKLAVNGKQPSYQTHWTVLRHNSTRLRLDLIVIISTPGWTISRRMFLGVSRERLSYGQLRVEIPHPAAAASRRQTSWAQEITSFRRLSVRGLSARSPHYCWCSSWVDCRLVRPLSRRHFSENALGKAAFNMWKCILIWVWSWLKYTIF